MCENFILFKNYSKPFKTCLKPFKVTNLTTICLHTHSWNHASYIICKVLNTNTCHSKVVINLSKLVSSHSLVKLVIFNTSFTIQVISIYMHKVLYTKIGLYSKLVISHSKLVPTHPKLVRSNSQITNKGYSKVPNTNTCHSKLFINHSILGSRVQNESQVIQD